MRLPQRLAVYLFFLLAGPTIAFFLGMGAFDAVECRGGGSGGECDLGGLFGLYGAGAALLLVVVAAIVSEMVVAARRR